MTPHACCWKLKPLLPIAAPRHRSNSTTLSSESPAAGDGGGWRSKGARGSGGSSAFPAPQTDIASRSVMRNNQCPRSPAVETPNLRSADLRVRAKDALVWGTALSPIITVPALGRKQKISREERSFFGTTCPRWESHDRVVAVSPERLSIASKRQTFSKLGVVIQRLFVEDGRRSSVPHLVRVPRHRRGGICDRTGDH